MSNHKAIAFCAAIIDTALFILILGRYIVRKEMTTKQNKLTATLPLQAAATSKQHETRTVTRVSVCHCGPWKTPVT